MYSDQNNSDQNIYACYPYKLRWHLFVKGRWEDAIEFFREEERQLKLAIGLLRIKT